MLRTSVYFTAPFSDLPLCACMHIQPKATLSPLFPLSHIGFTFIFSLCTHLGQRESLRSASSIQVCKNLKSISLVRKPTKSPSVFPASFLGLHSSCISEMYPHSYPFSALSFSLLPTPLSFPFFPSLSCCVAYDDFELAVFLSQPSNC